LGKTTTVASLIIIYNTSLIVRLQYRIPVSLIRNNLECSPNRSFFTLSFFPHQSSRAEFAGPTGCLW